MVRHCRGHRGHSHQITPTYRGAALRAARHRGRGNRSRVQGGGQPSAALTVGSRAVGKRKTLCAILWLIRQSSGFTLLMPDQHDGWRGAWRSSTQGRHRAKGAIPLNAIRSGVVEGGHAFMSEPGTTQRHEEYTHGKAGRASFFDRVSLGAEASPETIRSQATQPYNGTPSVGGIP